MVQTMNSSAPAWIHSPWCTHITLTALRSEQISRFEVNLSLGSAGISSSPQTDTGFPQVPLLLISQPIWTDSKTAYTTPTLLWQADAAGAVLYFTVSDCSYRSSHWPNVSFTKTCWVVQKYIQTLRTLLSVIV